MDAALTPPTTGDNMTTIIITRTTAEPATKEQAASAQDAYWYARAAGGQDDIGIGRGITRTECMQNAITYAAKAGFSARSFRCRDGLAWADAVLAACRNAGIDAHRGEIIAI